MPVDYDETVWAFSGKSPILRQNTVSGITQMADGGLVFVSYAHEDRERVRGLVALLDRKLRQINGSVFWDPDLPVGASVSEAVHRLLAEAACVVVVWTEKSVSSQWIQGECQRALRDGRLVPIKMDPNANIRPPFNSLKHGDLPQQIENGRGHCGQILVHYRRVGGVRDGITGHLSAEQLEEVDNTFDYLGTADGDAFSRMIRIGDYLQDEARAVVNFLFSGQENAARERIAATQKLLEPLDEELSQAIRERQQLGASLGCAS